MQENRMARGRSSSSSSRRAPNHWLEVDRGCSAICSRWSELWDRVGQADGHPPGPQLAAVWRPDTFSVSAGTLKDYYRILKVNPWAGTRTIKAAYRRLSKVYHPAA